MLFLRPALFISRQPQNRSAFSGSDVYLSAWAKGAFPLSFQWTFNGTNIPGATNAILKITAAQESDSGAYCAVVSNADGTVTSSNAVLNVHLSPPVVAAQFTNQTFLAGTNVTFAATAIGSLPLSYQWQHDGTDIASATNATLTLTNLQANQSGIYSVLVSNQFGITSSSNAVLDIIPFTITGQPRSQSVQETATISFSVTASGLSPLAYQWQFQGINLLQATNSSLVISNVQRTQAGVYSVVITNQYGTGISSNAYLTVGSIINSWGNGTSSLTNVPANATNVIAVAAGDQHCLALRADGTVVPWGGNSFGQIDVPSNLTDVVSVAAGSTHSLALRTDGTIRLWGSILGSGGTNDVPSSATNIAGLALGPGAQHALALRSDGTVLDWGNSRYGASLTNIPLMARNVVGVAAGATYGLALRSDGTVVQWGGTGQFGGSLPSVPSAATNLVALATGWFGNAGLRADGTVLVWGSVYPPTSSFTNVIDLACPENGSFQNCHLLALRRNGTLIENPNTAPAYATNNIAIIAAGSYNGFAAAGSGPPIFPGLPINRAVPIGSRAYFRALAAGAMPISYQWNCNGTNIPGATNTVLVLTNVQPAQAGNCYTLTASNASGVATSGPMVLNEYALENYVQPSSQSSLAGATATFTAKVIGQGPFVYQWIFAGSPLPGMTNSSLTLTNVQLNRNTKDWHR